MSSRFKDMPSPRALRRLFAERFVANVDSVLASRFESAVRPPGDRHLRRVVDALSRLIERVGGQETFASVIAAALDHPDLTTQHRQGLLVAILQMKVVAEEAERLDQIIDRVAFEEDASQMSETELVRAARELVARGRGKPPRSERLLWKGQA